MVASKLRIDHVVSSLKGGGMEHFVIRLCEAQRRRGHDAAVLAIYGGPLLEIAAAKGVPVTVLRAGMLQRVAHAAAHGAWRRPDVIHCHNPTSLRHGAIAKLPCRGRIVFTDHAQTKGLVRVPTALEWRLVDAFASVSAETARHAADIGYHGYAEVVHNGVEVTPPGRAAAEVRAELGLEGRVVGANVGSFFPVKAQDVLVRSVAELKKTGAPITILFVGDGVERARVERLAGDLGLDASDVRFLGFRNDVADILAASDFFVLPSRAEGLPLSILEAMSRALPIVCTAVGGNPELVTEGEQGYLVPVDDPGALAAAMGRLVADEGLRRRLGEAGRARVASEFSFERTTDRYESAYRRVLGGESRWGETPQDPGATSTAS